jgi:hypothetical protein
MSIVENTKINLNTYLDVSRPLAISLKAGNYFGSMHSKT